MPRAARSPRPRRARRRRRLPKAARDEASHERSRNVIERLERAASRLIEGWTARLFGAKLQPVQLAKRVIRTMESHQTISLAKTFVPNSYVVSLDRELWEAVCARMRQVAARRLGREAA